MRKKKTFSKEQKSNYGKDSKESKSTNSRRKGRSATQSDDYQADRRDSRNDISWYVADPQVLQDVASLPFSNQLQSITSPFNYETSGFSGGTYSIETPGIMTFHMHPTYGFGSLGSPIAEAATDPLNIAAKSVYSYVRKHNSGSANYDEVDLMQYIISMDNVYAMWCWAVRLYGIARTYNYKNRYCPEGLLGQMGLSSSQQQALLQDLASFRSMLNMFAIRMSSLAVPTVMPIIQRHFWLYSNVFQDCDDPKGQYYLYNPASYYTYDEVNGKCEWHKFSPASWGNSIVGGVRALLNSMLDPLLYSQSIGIMSGDILKAYEGNIYSFSTVPEDFTVLPTYNEKVLTQIHHITTSCLIPSDIVQTNNYLYTLYNTTSDNYDNTSFADQVRNSDMFLNLPYQNPTPEDVMYATRLMVSAGTGGLGIVCGSEVVEYISISDDDIDGTNWLYNPNGNGHLSTSVVIDDTDINLATDLWRNLKLNVFMQMFDWAPRLNLAHTISGTSIDEVFFVGDLANYTIVSPQTLRNIHSAAFCGLYGIPYTLTRA